MGYRVSGSGMATRVLRAFPRLVSSGPFPVLGSKGSQIRASLGGHTGVFTGVVRNVKGKSLTLNLKCCSFIVPCCALTVPIVVMSVSGLNHRSTVVQVHDLNVTIGSTALLPIFRTAGHDGAASETN